MEQPLRAQTYFHETFQVYHVYYNFILGNICRITVNFVTLKDGSLLIFFNIMPQTIVIATETSSKTALTLCQKIDDAYLTKAEHFFFFRII